MTSGQGAPSAAVVQQELILGVVRADAPSGTASASEALQGALVGGANVDGTVTPDDAIEGLVS